MDYTLVVIDLLQQVTNLSKSQIAEIIEIPSNPELADIAFPCFKLSKEFKKNPQIIAKEIKEKIILPEDSIIEKVKVDGPYLNFFFNESKLAKLTLEQIWKEKEKYGYLNKTDAAIVVEFPAPNTNKPLHLGHLRNMAIGESISRILEAQGYSVRRVNLYNDRGIHICKSMLAYKKWGDSKQPNKKPDHFVGDYYILYSQEEKNSPELIDEAQELLKKWEQKDPGTLDLWKKMNDWAITGINESFNRFDVSFDKHYYESDIWEEGKKIILQGLKDKIFSKDENDAIVADVGELGTKILLRPDGTSVYIVQDIFLAKLKHDDYKFEKSIYVVANEQNHHFKVLFKILEMLGYKFAKGCYHLNYGMVSLPEGRMKSREGTIVDADVLMNKLAEMAKDEIKSRREVTESNLNKLSESIGLAALKYYLLKFSAHKDFLFNPKESISFEGETGVFLLYSLVRAKKIQQKIKQQATIDVNFNLFGNEEISLVKKMTNYPNIISKAADLYAPHILAKYTFELASIFNIFYENCPVSSEKNEDLKKARIVLVDAFIHVMRNCLYLLGIKEVEEM
ncbi:MAG: arginine--tRNA ligase [Candidatus Hodarchaeota archaeon]